MINIFLKPWSVPEVLRPLYESSSMVAQRLTIAVSTLLLIHSVEFYCKLWQTIVIIVENIQIEQFFS
jgi:hypothetical protein